MNEERQIAFMQARITRMASRRWDKPLRQVAELFAEFGVLRYIEECFDYFHLESDLAVLCDVERYLRIRGVAIDDEIA